MLLFLLLAAAVTGSPASAEEAVTGAARALLAKYPSVAPKLQKNLFGAPIYLESFENKGTAEVDMYGVFGHTFHQVKDTLAVPANWCDITSLHINIKACTAKKTGSTWLVTLYSGRKYYQPPGDAYPLKLTFRVVAQQPDYLNVTLQGDQGPLRTKDHRIRLEAVPLDGGKSFVHFSYSYRTGTIATMAIKSYFATVARDKVGFSTVAGPNGNRVLVTGVRGAVERNAVRYYLALECFLDALKTPEKERFERRIGEWYDLTARYPRQLKELEKNEYLANKRREQQNQLTLQGEAALLPGGGKPDEDT
ncbi:hypothetical protein GMLC_34300 [Geomonas limicola]|uniref:Uncharacterized protein n=2 Tax=Geomonas limicola TaxID=2740186 RepID=A0A6V8NBG4_9BACT|nr:hypothetical protein GMLC_34300 [Geomonas limicola]